MASKVEICNLALQELGERRITSLEEQTEEARHASLAFDHVRKATIRLHPWNSTTARASLPKEVAVPAWGYSNSYPLPGDVLCVYDVDYDGDLPWRVEGRKLLTDIDSPLGILYGRDETDTESFDPLLTEALSLALAVRLCEPLTQSNTKKAQLQAALDMTLSTAKGVDGREQSPGEIEEDPWIAARYRR